MGERTERAKSTIKGAVAPEAAALQARGEATAPLGTSENPSNKVFTLANVITFCRFLLTFAFLALFVSDDGTHRSIALLCYTVAAVTDFLDGQIARRTQTVSWLGKVMDPVMDRVLLFCGVLGLMMRGELPLWVAVAVVGRDVSLILGALWLRKFQTRPMDVIYIGKIATALLMSGFVLMLIASPQIAGLNLVDVAWLPGLNGDSTSLGTFLVYAGTVCSLITAAIYWHDGLKIRSEVLSGKRARS